MKILKTLSIYISFSALLLPIVALAQNTTPPPAIVINIPNPTTVGNDLMSIIVALISNVVMPVAAVAVVIMIIWSGFTFLTAQGNPKKIQEAQKRLLWALIGGGILLGAAGIAEVVKNTVNSLTQPL